MVNVKNPGSKISYQIPSRIAELMFERLKCKTDGRDKSGIRFVNVLTENPIVFFEKITNSCLNIYILPSGKFSWRTVEELKRVLQESGNEHLINTIRTDRESAKELRLKAISWDDAFNCLIPIHNWVNDSQG